MGWSTNAQARRYMNITSTSVISDADVNDHLLSADREIRRIVFAHHYDEVLDGNINGTNKEFRTKYKPIADGDMDGSIDDAGDVTAYTIDIDETTGFRESTSAAVTSINSRDGIITLTTAPANTVNEVTLDYYSVSPRIDMDDVDRAASMLAAIFCLMQLSGGSAAGYSYTAGRFSIQKGSSDGRAKLIQDLISKYEMLLSNMRVGIRRA